MVGRCVASWNSLFLGDMLVFGGVSMSTMDQRESLVWSHSLVPCFFAGKALTALATSSNGTMTCWGLRTPCFQRVLWHQYLYSHKKTKSSRDIPSLKLTVSPLKMDGLKTTSLLRPDLFSGPLAVSFKEGRSCDFFSNLVSCRRVALLQPFQRENHAWWWQVPPNVMIPCKWIAIQHLWILTIVLYVQHCSTILGGNLCCFFWNLDADFFEDRLKTIGLKWIPTVVWSWDFLTTWCSIESQY